MTDINCIGNRRINISSKAICHKMWIPVCQMQSIVICCTAAPMNIYSNILILSIKAKRIGIISSMSFIFIFSDIYYNVIETNSKPLLPFVICICNILIRIRLQLIMKLNFSFII